MGNSSSSNRVSARDRAILDLKLQRDQVQKYQKQIRTTSLREIAVARECLRRGDRSRAKLALRRQKYHNSILTTTDEQLFQLEKLVADVEFALVQKDVIFGIQQGTAVLKDIHRQIGTADQVEKLLADNEEATAYQEELNQLLGSRMSRADETAVEDELATMEAEILSSKLPLARTDPIIHVQPVTEPVSNENQDENKYRSDEADLEGSVPRELVPA